MTDKDKHIEMLAFEAFLRRASALKQPFMLKGSFVTRQYMPHTSIRIPNDLDWVYTGNLTDIDDAKEKFNAWAIAVTEMQMADNIAFRSFRENAFWRMIDYAMADDFPTINTDIRYYYKEKLTNKIIEGDISFDLSFNLDIEVPPVQLLYNPIEGDPFIVPYTVPLALQISWKIHQSLVRPRFKDLFDLTYLLKHELYNHETKARALQALVNECSADNVDLKKLEYLLSGNWEPLFPNSVIFKNEKSPNGSSLYETWDYWRHKKQETDYRGNVLTYEDASEITNPDAIPADLNDFKKMVLEAFEFAGFTTSVLRNLPSVTRVNRKTYEEKVNMNDLKIKTDIITQSVQQAHNTQKTTDDDSLKKLPDVLNKKIEPEESLFKKIKGFFGKK